MTTDSRKIETPFGPKIGKLWGALEILGVSSLFTQTGNRPNEFSWPFELVDIDVPVGTLAIIPMPNLWYLGYGSMQPEHVDPTDDNATLQWKSEDHNWGLGWVQVSVVDVNEPDFSVSPPAQSAQLRVEVHLRDENADDSMVGAIGYSLLFLGKAQASGGTQIRSAEVREQDPEHKDLLKKRRLG